MSAGITLLPKHVRAHQGNPKITRFCPTCRERTVPKGDICLWCDTSIVQPNAEPQRRWNRPRRLAAHGQPKTIYEWLVRFGPAPAKVIEAATGIPHAGTRMAELQRRGMVEQVGTIDPPRDAHGFNMGRPQVIYAAIVKDES
jgi:hypothetical protein